MINFANKRNVHENLEKESELTQFDKSQEFQAVTAKNIVQQNYVKNMLDELQVEYKKFDTSLEKRKDKKKRKNRMGGQKIEE